MTPGAHSSREEHADGTDTPRHLDDPDKDTGHRIITALLEAHAHEYPAPVGNDNLAAIGAGL